MSTNPPSTPEQKSTGVSSPSSVFPPKLRNGSIIRRPKGPLTRGSSIAFLVILMLLAASTVGAVFVLAHRDTASGVQVVGRVSFVSSGRLYVNNNQGINDEVLFTALGALDNEV